MDFTYKFNPLNITGCQVDYSPNCSFSNGLQGKVKYLLVDGTSQCYTNLGTWIMYIKAMHIKSS